MVVRFWELEQEQSFLESMFPPGDDDFVHLRVQTDGGEESFRSRGASGTLRRTNEHVLVGQRRFRCGRTVVCRDGTCSAKSNASIYFYSREKNVILNVRTVLTVSGCRGARTNKLFVFFLKKLSGFYSFSRLMRKSRKSAEIPAKNTAFILSSLLKTPA